MDLLDLFERGTEWTASKIAPAADKLDTPTGCDGWDVRNLVDHMIDTQRYFAASARGEEAALPDPSPPSLIGGDPVGAYAAMTKQTLRAFREPGDAEAHDERQELDRTQSPSATSVRQSTGCRRSLRR